MIVEILKSERTCFEKAAELLDIKVLFYSNEREEMLLKMEVVDNLSNKMTFLFTRAAYLTNDIIKFTGADYGI